MSASNNDKTNQMGTLDFNWYQFYHALNIKKNNWEKTEYFYSECLRNFIRYKMPGP